MAHAIDRRSGPVVALLAAPGALTVYVAFRAGGFFPGTQGVLAAGLAVALALRLTLVERPLAGASRALVVVAGALTLYAAWALVSVWWSGSPARATLEFDRALLYLLTLVLFGLAAMTPARAALDGPWARAGPARDLRVRPRVTCSARAAAHHARVRHPAAGEPGHLLERAGPVGRPGSDPVLCT